MARKRYTTEQIIGLLREAEVRPGQGQTIGAICRGMGFTEQSYYRWRRECGGLKLDHAKRLKDLERENGHLKRSLSVDPQWHATWVVLARPDGQPPADHFIGMINYHARQPWNRKLALGWILIPRFQGRGYMQEAVRAVLAHCFTALNTHRVEAEIEPENVRSARLAQRLGFQREGLLRDRLFVADRPRTQQMYGLLRSEWRS